MKNAKILYLMEKEQFNMPMEANMQVFFKDSVRDGKGKYYFGIDNKIKCNFKDGKSPGLQGKKIKKHRIILKFI